MQDFRLTLVQCSPAYQGGYESNMELLDQAMQTAAEADSKLVAFPEVSLTGYLVQPAAVRERALPLDHPVVNDAVGLTEKHSLYAAFGLFERGPTAVFNTYLLAGHGKRLGVSRKVHVPDRELGLFQAGDAFHVFDLPFARVGLSICFDNEVCESHLLLALQGAEVIIMPSAWADHWEREDYVEPCTSDEAVVAERRRWMHMMFGARCRDTGTYSALINHAGPEAGGPWRFVGKSMAFAPTGRVLAEAVAWDEDMLHVDLDAALLHNYRSMPSWALRNRRPDAYARLSDPRSCNAWQSSKQNSPACSRDSRRQTEKGGSPNHGN